MSDVRPRRAGCGDPLLVSMLGSLRDQTALISAAGWAASV
ncbi:hypothetical protein HD596_011069 [Nonomuraea jabiensis]|uniref:Uncharacterized protein n=1 Tax=Nonomuraea jabiensis TaxID=882448 RepID=A0A7W9GIH5_9ACTN|nr:hypothetical protein [Nonomuraea jabiensis]